jgi:uncharacterized lipoprotein YmbA
MKLIVPSLLLVCTLCAGCSNKPVQSSEYLLRPASPSITSAGESISIALGSVAIPPYLDQQGLVLETAPNEINAARNHRWAEPLSYSVQRYLQVAISQASGLDIGGRLTPVSNIEKQIDVAIHQFHTTAQGSVRLVAEWRILETGNKKVLVHRDFTASEVLAVDGYPAVVRAHGMLLNRLAAAIGTELGQPE